MARQALDKPLSHVLPSQLQETMVLLSVSADLILMGSFQRWNLLAVALWPTYPSHHVFCVHSRCTERQEDLFLFNRLRILLWKDVKFQCLSAPVEQEDHFSSFILQAQIYRFPQFSNIEMPFLLRAKPTWSQHIIDSLFFWQDVIKFSLLVFYQTFLHCALQEYWMNIFFICSVLAQLLYWNDK